MTSLRTTLSVCQTNKQSHYRIFFQAVLVDYGAEVVISDLWSIHTLCWTHGGVVLSRAYMFCQEKERRSMAAEQQESTSPNIITVFR